MAKILLVDDDKDVRQFGAALLASAGHDAFLAEGTVEALEFLQTNIVDILITDANMPVHSGFDLLLTLKKNPRIPRDMSIVMLTGRRERKDIERAVLLGAHDYIVKPIDPMVFLQKVKDLLDRRPVAERPQAEFASLTLSSAARAAVAVELLALSEIGLLVKIPHQFPEGTMIEIDSDIFTKIGITPPLLRVLSSVEKNDHWESRVAFIGADERTLTKIRAWVYSQTPKGRARTA